MIYGIYNLTMQYFMSTFLVDKLDKYYPNSFFVRNGNFCTSNINAAYKYKSEIELYYKGGSCTDLFEVRSMANGIYER